MSFSCQNYVLQCQSLFVCNVTFDTEPSQVVQAIQIHGGPEIISDELKLAEASFS